MQRLPDPRLTPHECLFPRRSPRQSSANAAEGGLEPPPAGRLRRAINPSSPIQHRDKPPCYIRQPPALVAHTAFLEAEHLGPNDAIEAVAVGEVYSWWKSPDGERYNELNLTLADDGVAIERIFVVASVAELYSLRASLLRQLERSINCYVVSSDPSREITGFLLIATKQKPENETMPQGQHGPALTELSQRGHPLMPRRFAALQ